MSFEDPTPAEVTAAINTLADRCEARENPVPGVHTLALAFGGELSITDTGDNYRLRVDVEGGQFSIALTALDVMGIRSMVGDIIVGRLQEVSS